MNYFVQVGSEIQGPISREEIRQRLAQGELEESALVREVNAEDWETVDALKRRGGLSGGRRDGLWY